MFISSRGWVCTSWKAGEGVWITAVEDTFGVSYAEQYLIDRYNIT